MAENSENSSMPKAPLAGPTSIWLVLIFNRLMGALVVLAVTAFVVWCVFLWVPEEEAPTIRILENGATEFYLQTLRQSIFVPVAILTVLTAAACFGLLQQKTLGLRPKKSVGGVVGAIGCSILAFLLLFLFLVVLWATVFKPFFDIRSIVLEEKSVHLRSLLYSWTIPASDIEAVEITEGPTYAPALKELQLQIKTKNGPTRQTVEFRVRKADPAFRRTVDFLEDLKSRLLTKN